MSYSTSIPRSILLSILKSRRIAALLNVETARYSSSSSANALAMLYSIPQGDSFSSEEKESPWGIEYSIARAFAEELELYRAVSTFKRAAILLDLSIESKIERGIEVEYDILLCYFLAKKYDSVIES